MDCSIAKEHRPRACSWLLNVKCERTVPFFGHSESVQGSSITIGIGVVVMGLVNSRLSLPSLRSMHLPSKRCARKKN